MDKIDAMDSIDAMDTMDKIDTMDKVDHRIDSLDNQDNVENMENTYNINRIVNVDEDKLHEYKTILIKQIETEETDLAMKYFLLYTIDDKINHVK